MVGVVELVRLSVVVPVGPAVSVDVSRSSADGATFAVSVVIAREVDAMLVLPAASVAVTVIGWMPSASAADRVMLNAPVVESATAVGARATADPLIES
jgi:hypothetical protein